MLITHNLENVENYADKIFVLEDKKLVEPYKSRLYQNYLEYKKQKEIKKNVETGNADVNTVTEQYEGKFKDKLESYTQKTKDKSKQFNSSLNINIK